MRRIRSILRQFLFIIPAMLGLLLYCLLPSFPQVAEWVFSRFLFRQISVPVGGIVSLFPFSLTELLVILAIPGSLALLVLLVVRIIRSSSRLRTAGIAAKGIAWTLSFTFLAYMLLHGVNFYRLPVQQLMGLDVSAKTPEFLQQVCIDLAQKASEARAELSEDENGYTRLSETLDQTLRQADKGYRILAPDMPYLSGGVWRTKPVQMSHLWSYTGITGMYFPMLCEANVNIDVPESSIPATAAHELAHTRGFASEDECNFLAYLTCINSPSADYRYSGYLLAYIYCSNALYGFDTEMWGAVQPYCSDGVHRDLGERNEYWEQFEGEVEEISSSVNDTFLEIQGVDDGVLSYDRVVELILAYYAKTM